MGSLNLGKLAGFTVLALVLAFAIGAAGNAADLPVAAGSVLIFIVVLLLALAARRREIGRWSYERRRWTGERDGRAVELIFDERLGFLNRLTLLVGEQEVDRATIFYGTKTLSGAPVDERPVTVTVKSGWIGECVGVVFGSADESHGSLVESGKA